MNPVAQYQSLTRILVPVANPDTATKLLKLASGLVNREGGTVIALFVLRGELEAESKALSNLEPVVEKLKEEGYPIRLETHKASNVARGIIDAARDNGSDLIVLGVQRPARGNVLVGTIDENVLTTAPCPVVVYRPAKSESVKRVVIPADGGMPAQTACVIGIKLAQNTEIDVDAVYIQPGYYSRWKGLGRIEQSLENIEGKAQVKRTLITALDPAQGLLARLNEDDLLVVGYTGRSEFERWLFGDFSRQMLDHSPCAVLLVSPMSQSLPVFQRTRKSLNRFILRLTPAELEDITRQAFDLSATNMDYLVLIAIAAVLASLGLLGNSAAVIIGAMLVAPFMQPCIALAIGIVSGQFTVARRALVSLSIGIVLAVAIAGMTGLLAQGRPFTPEMVARSNPMLVDALVAFASGIIGAYATARKEIPSALAGVAIAAALMPPLCTFGLGLTVGNIDMGMRAGLLFVTNVVCIALAASVIFFLVGLRPLSGGEGRGFAYRRTLAFSLLAVITLGLMLNLGSLTQRSQHIEQWLSEALLPAQVRDVDIHEGTPLTVSVVVWSTQPIMSDQVTNIQQRLSEDLMSPVHLEVVVQQIITSR